MVNAMTAYRTAVLRWGVYFLLVDLMVWVIMYLLYSFDFAWRIPWSITTPISRAWETYHYPARHFIDPFVVHRITSHSYGLKFDLIFAARTAFLLFQSFVLGCFVRFFFNCIKIAARRLFSS